MVDSTSTTAASFFFDVATSVFDGYFQELGARRETSASPSNVRYLADTWFAEVLYIPSDGPSYVPRVEIGCRNAKFDDPRRNRVDVMHTAPVGSEEHDYNLRWRYKSKRELKRALTSVRDRILKVYTLPFLQDTNRLQMLLKQRCGIVEAAWAQEIDEHNEAILRADAEKAFKLKDYGKAVQCYCKIRPENRSQLDESRLRVARSRVN